MVEPVLHLVWANMVFSNASVTGSIICVFRVKQGPDNQYKVNSCITSATGSLFKKHVDWGPTVIREETHDQHKRVKRQQHSTKKL